MTKYGSHGHRAHRLGLVARAPGGRFTTDVRFRRPSMAQALAVEINEGLR
jgi:hypothetical protein